MTFSIRFAAFCAILLFSSAMLHAQEHILGMRIKDVELQLGTEFTKTQDGPVTRLIYGSMITNHPKVGRIIESDQYDFLDGVCEARHSYIPLAYKQKFIDYLNAEFGFSDRLWRGEHNTYIAIKDRDNEFELMVWTPVYERMLDNR